MRKLSMAVAASLLTFLIGVSVVTFMVVRGDRPLSSLAQPQVPEGWHAVDARGLFKFYLPGSMRLTSDMMSEESAWGSTFSDDKVKLYAEYSSWNESYAPEYLAKQFEYQEEATTIDGKRGRIQSWRWAEPPFGSAYEAEVRIFDEKGRMLVRMYAECKDRQGVEIAKQIFRTVEFP